ncbi:hypothetical protein CDEF62S_05050 [Castellaniella defragrans]
MHLDIYPVLGEKFFLFRHEYGCKRLCTYKQFYGFIDRHSLGRTCNDSHFQQGQ